MKKYIVLIVFTGLSVFSEDQNLSPAPNPAPSIIDLEKAKGRYQIIEGTYVKEKTMFKIDTATGRVWRLLQVGRGDDQIYGWTYLPDLTNDQIPKVRAIAERELKRIEADYQNQLKEIKAR